MRTKTPCSINYLSDMSALNMHAYMHGYVQFYNTNGI